MIIFIFYIDPILVLLHVIDSSKKNLKNDEIFNGKLFT